MITVVSRRWATVISPDVQESLETTHFLWNNWPDRGVPADNMVVLKLIARLGKLSPCAIHCSAGTSHDRSACNRRVAVDRHWSHGHRRRARHDHDAHHGRHGSHLQEGWRTWCERFRIDALEVLQDLRAARHGSVQMDVQYLYAHRVIVACAISKGVSRCATRAASHASRVPLAAHQGGGRGDLSLRVRHAHPHDWRHGQVTKTAVSPPPLATHADSALLSPKPSRTSSFYTRVNICRTHATR